MNKSTEAKYFKTKLIIPARMLTCSCWFCFQQRTVYTEKLLTANAKKYYLRSVNESVRINNFIISKRSAICREKNYKTVCTRVCRGNWLNPNFFFIFFFLLHTVRVQNTMGNLCFICFLWFCFLHLTLVRTYR